MNVEQPTNPLLARLGDGAAALLTRIPAVHIPGCGCEARKAAWVAKLRGMGRG